MIDVFQAVADGTRRDMLERLRLEGPLSVSALAAPLAMTRQAATKHLDVLEGAGLIRHERRGRERLHVLESEPLQAVETWLAPYAAAWDRRLERLKRHLDEE